MADVVQNDSFDDASLAALQSQASQEGRVCVVGALIVDSEGRIFVQKRALHSDLLPGCWDIVGGHVETGETLLAALAREIQEETGWQLQKVTRLVSVVDWETVGLESSIPKREFDFLAIVDGDLDRPQLEGHEVMASEWIGQAQVHLVQENRQPDDRFMIDLISKALHYISGDPL